MLIGLLLSMRYSALYVCILYTYKRNKKRFSLLSFEDVLQSENFNISHFTYYYGSRKN